MIYFIIIYAVIGVVIAAYAIKTEVREKFMAMNTIYRLVSFVLMIAVAPILFIGGFIIAIADDIQSSLKKES